MIKERAKTDFPFNSSASWHVFEDMVTYCKQKLHCSAEAEVLAMGKIAQANSMISTQISVSSIT